MQEPVALVQGLYFLVTGIWPILEIDSFLMVTGPKTDLWLVKTVGIALAAVGASLALAGWQGDLNPATVTLGVASAAGLGALETWYVARRVIAPVYLVDALVELVFVLWWLARLG
ncbi:hypothetical protein GMLC_24340 [Geomonas limicola]|uniref:Uncharacterized protein n=1 Tax=Geomonas limicola TaxID=2740186 RepID=A0A6V8N8F0_9BACT|nr:hypothetical protein [Geomonas limicola]GFO68855.1 hypothetical protein GMLC_24340 [Geomonas limicola]